MCEMGSWGVSPLAPGACLGGSQERKGLGSSQAPAVAGCHSLLLKSPMFQEKPEIQPTGKNLHLIMNSESEPV